ncbi:MULTISPECIES: hypothetical protein [Bacillus]|uniref:Uncharacterized protein n=1 Tax=Bacillus glycinifermentans TaxID=1664069 RepID=A0AAJ3Z1K8_9BACI|nr:MULTISPECIES: hypothetical protein [Bacillus]MDU0071725.1 hypothetical protein [Bacillus sp. IG6]MED8019886.1 hypothetical protein [Bacillus glycinifermentans]QAT64700.1 hypothetical protein EQZ20_07160 [Bacillus glycinifermentans]QAT67126.1 hypothetical protein EQZ20_21070 [Bacillus glycinifermentans]
MTKTNEKIHVLADESLGGIKREYVEVDRKAKVGDMVVLPGEGNSAEHVVEVRGFEGDYKLESGFYIRQDFVNTLEPTNIVHIDGPDGTERYELTDRKAEEGDKILTTQTQFGRLPVGKVLTVTDVFDDASVGELGVGIVEKTDYRVLVPVESSEEEPQPSDPIDVIANLATRVAELERENKRIKEDLGWDEMGPGRIAELRNDVSDIRHDIKALEEKIEHDYATNEDTSDFLYEETRRLQDEIDTLHKDNRRHGEELARLEKGMNSQAQRHVYRQQEIERVWERIDQIETKTEALKHATEETDGKVAHLESDSDMRLFTAEEVAALLNAMRERQ